MTRIYGFFLISLGFVAFLAGIAAFCAYFTPWIKDMGLHIIILYPLGLVLGLFAGDVFRLFNRGCKL